MKLDVSESISNRKIIKEYTVKELISYIRNPDHEHKNAVLAARLIGKGYTMYKVLKKALPVVCVVHKHNNKITKPNCIDTTGYIYMDIDEKIDKELLDKPYIVGYWKSLSDIGYSVIASVEGININNYKEVTIQLAKYLGVSIDRASYTASRCVVISYDTEAVYNPNVTPISIEELGISEKCSFHSYPYGVTLSSYDRNEQIEGRTDWKLNFDNLFEIYDNLSFEDQLVFDMGTKIEYSKLFLPKKYITNNRYMFLSALGLKLKSLNPWVTLEILKTMLFTYNRRCSPSLPDVEVIRIAQDIHKKPLIEIETRNNSTKRFFFNKDKDISLKKKRQIVATAIGKDKMMKTKEKMREAIDNWEGGKLTPSSLSKTTGISRGTIYKYFSEFEDKINKINFENSNV